MREAAHADKEAEIAHQPKKTHKSLQHRAQATHAAAPAISQGSEAGAQLVAWLKDCLKSLAKACGFYKGAFKMRHTKWFRLVALLGVRFPLRSLEEFGGCG